jgi:hypothetical protein
MAANFFGAPVIGTKASGMIKSIHAKLQFSRRPRIQNRYLTLQIILNNSQPEDSGVGDRPQFEQNDASFGLRGGPYV